MRVVGIDPGISGAVAWLEDNNAAVYAMPSTPVDLYQLLRSLDADMVFVEKQGMRPGQSTQSAFKTGQNMGIILGVTASLMLPVVVLSPQSWKKTMGLIGKDKEASRALALQMWPKLPLPFKKDEGKAEAALIAYAGRKGMA